VVVFAGQGEAERSMRLLWRAGASEHRTSPGPKPALSVDDIIQVATDIADAEGMGALSMRTVGERLGRTAMALYTYVPSKRELLDLMYDQLLGELPSAYDAGLSWREALTAWANDWRAFYLRHPWVLQISQARPVLGPGEFASTDAAAGVLDRTGLPAAEQRRVFAVLTHFVRGNAAAVVDQRQAAAATGVTDEEWWSGRASLLGEVAPDFTDRFPRAMGLQSGAAFAPGQSYQEYVEAETERSFAFGLQALLDGIHAP
jgi:AcrR family transcriptional regulator